MVMARARVLPQSAYGKLEPLAQGIIAPFLPACACKCEVYTVE